MRHIMATQNDESGKVEVSGVNEKTAREVKKSLHY